jgi:spermidine/putrescine transport system permease protein
MTAVAAAGTLRSARRRLAGPILLFGPPFLFVLVFLVYPYANVFQFSFFRVEDYKFVHEYSWNNYLRAINGELYQRVLLVSARIAFLVTLCALPLAYALAYYAAFVVRRWRHVLYFLVVTPLWTSFLLRVYVWKLILGRTGLVNSALTLSGLTSEPLSFLIYNQFSVCLTLVYILIPFFFLPIYTALEKINPAYLEASADLGAPPFRTFWRVIVPLSLPGVITGAIFTFCLSFGDFVAPALLGGPGGTMVSNVIVGQFGAAFDWPFGSALAVIVLLTVLAVIGLGSLAERKGVGASE